MTVVSSLVLLARLLDPAAKADSETTGVFIAFCLSLAGCLVIIDHTKTARPETD